MQRKRQEIKMEISPCFIKNSSLCTVTHPSKKLFYIVFSVLFHHISHTFPYLHDNSVLTTKKTYTGAVVSTSLTMQWFLFVIIIWEPPKLLHPQKSTKKQSFLIFTQKFLSTPVSIFLHYLSIFLQGEFFILSWISLLPPPRRIPLFYLILANCVFKPILLTQVSPKPSTVSEKHRHFSMLALKMPLLFSNSGPFIVSCKGIQDPIPFPVADLLTTLVVFMRH